MIENMIEMINKTPINVTELQSYFRKMNTVDIADIFENLSKERTIQIFRLLPKDISADVFSYIVSEKQQIIVEALTDTEVGKIIDELFADDAVDFIEEMPANVVKRVLQNVSEDRRQLINHLLQYPEDSAGSIMTTEYVALREYSTVREAFDEIRSTGVNKETIYTCYVIRRDRLLVGVVTAKILMLSKPQDLIGDVMDTNMKFAHTTDDQEIIAGLFRKYSLLSIPIVDKERRLVGIVTVDDIVHIIEEEATEDFEKMAAISPSDEPYMKTGVFEHARNRIVWLLLLMLSATITGSIISGFEDILSTIPVLVAFIPMLMDTGGNAGSQSSVLIVRGMALGEIEIKDIFKVLWREARVGALCGFALGAVNFIRVYIMNGGDLQLCVTVSASLIATVIIAKAVGCTLPFIAKMLKMDPAVMTAPVVTTIADAAALMVYFTLAMMLMSFQI
ncbi:MAG: magnesium transporter [Oscillospiraceae bacterium]|nr:magnesium transporter [Oscillospiraceae bacterium]